MATKTLARPFELRDLSDKGTFQGYGSVFGVLDYYDDIVMPGAFQRSLAEHKANRTMPLLLWQHDTAEPIGVYTSMVEDDRGLVVEGQLALKTQRGAEAYELLKMGAFSGLSIGFSTKKYEMDKETGTRKLLDLDLWEVSPVSFPANDKARVEAIRARGDVPDIRSLEEVLREAGLSRMEAKTVLRGGYSALRDAAPLQREAGASRGEANEILSMIRSLRIGG